MDGTDKYKILSIYIVNCLGTTQHENTHSSNLILRKPLLF